MSTQPRSTKTAISKGLRMRCPSCGDGPLFHGYLKVKDSCNTCATQLHHHRADDGPAYLTILVVAHLLVPIYYIASTVLQLSPLYVALSISLFGVGLCLWLLPRLKGLVVAIQWSKYMHGFSQENASSK